MTAAAAARPTGAHPRLQRQAEQCAASKGECKAAAGHMAAACHGHRSASAGARRRRKALPAGSLVCWDSAPRPCSPAAGSWHQAPALEGAAVVACGHASLHVCASHDLRQLPGAARRSPCGAGPDSPMLLLLAHAASHCAPAKPSKSLARPLPKTSFRTSPCHQPWPLLMSCRTCKYPPAGTTWPRLASDGPPKVRLQPAVACWPTGHGGC